MQADMVRSGLSLNMSRKAPHTTLINQIEGFLTDKDL